MAILVESAVRATLIAAAVAVTLRAMRITVPAVRHAAWAGVTVMMLLLPALVTWAPPVSLPLLPAAAATRVSVVSTLEDSSVTAPGDGKDGTRGAETTRSVWSGPTFLAGLYLIGLCWFVLRLAVGTWQARMLLRGAVLHNDRLTHASCATPVTMGWLTPSVMLPPGWTQWPEGQLDAILAHETEHVRRRDPLCQWLALLNRAVFWFHPLAWWLERQLSGLAEEACDAAVLARGHDPHDYSEYLLNFARAVERAGGRVHALGMAMPGTGLPHRIRQILDGARAPRLSRKRLAFTAGACALAAATLTLGTLAQAQAALPSFEVASIRQNRSGASSGGSNLTPGGGLTARNETLQNLILAAYDIQNARLRGAPGWLASDAYDIDARPAAAATSEQTQLMVRSLLAERFKLRLHWETEEVTGYALTIAKSGHRLKPNADPACVPPSCGGANLSALGRLAARKIPLSEFAPRLERILGRPVLDRTRLEGDFDMDLEWAPEASQFEGRGREVPNDTRPSLFTALEEQLGLKLEPARASVQFLVIDSVERPSEN